MIFATDLDNTMIFSHRLISGYEDKVYCVEYYNGKAITYMTYTAIEKIKNLMKKIHVIPITTRSISQFERIEIFSSATYAVVANGGTILKNGIIHPEWEQYINGILHKYNFEDVIKVFSNLPNLTLQPKVVDGKFVFAKSDDINSCKQILQNKLDTKIWQLSFQGAKMYAIPMEITKGNALKFINEKIINDKQPVISAGDSNLDLSMLEYSDYSIIPWGCNLSSPKYQNFIELGNSFLSSDAILDFVTNLSV
ncbi:MAG: HAD hydrolase family protein [Clostridia bacterium]|nr:HAD hydrolase family protein [Clostridia bacterium]